MTLDIFERRWQDSGAVMWPLGDSEKQAAITNDVLDAVQTIVDVLVEEGQAYRVSFAQHATAYTDMGEKRIVVTAKPMTEGGRTLDDIAAIITAFAVHEVGHARTDEHIGSMVSARWPGKTVPMKLCNVLQDVRLEAAIVARFRGFEGIFEPAFEWLVSKRPAGLVAHWGPKLATRLNFISDVARYAPWATFATDPGTVRERAWFDAWATSAVGASDERLVELVQEALDHMAAQPEPPQPEGPKPEGPGRGRGNDPEGEEPTEDGEPGDDGEPNDGDTEDAEEPDGEGKGEDKSDGDSDDPDGEGEDDSENPGLTPEDKGKTNTMDRRSGETQVGDGAGGSGQMVTDAPGSDPLDESALDKADLDPTVDDLNHTVDYSGDAIQQTADRERDSVWLTAGAHGRMKVRVEF